MTSNVKPLVLVHGGAGDIPESRVQMKLDCVCKAASEGYKVLNKTGCVLDAIVAAVEIMEDDESMNAGKGSVLNLDGEIEMEALICEGRNLNAGSVTLVQNVAHPITLARLVMEKTPHTMLGAEGAKRFAEKMGIPYVQNDQFIIQSAKDALKEFKEHKLDPSRTEIGERPGEKGTVGAIAVDISGHLASATSTGGITGKMKGRIGDTPLLGCGGYADDDIGAVSTTGHGESIMRYNLAQRILSAMNNGQSAQEATKSCCEGMTARVGNSAGAITLSKDGSVGVFFTSKRMAWAYQLGNEIHYGIDAGQHLIMKV
uniref:Isoaspartyl peptidase/L-asparaginase n=1 Tax=Clastoptera arizonana TaxID=38151 RepID=A0A1B6CCI1_9HEMI